MAKTLVYTITPGRSGTQYLALLLRANLPNGSSVHHERLNWRNLGVRGPEASQLLCFNMIGNHDRLRAFWQRKLALDVAEPCEIYAETSHLNAKAGLFENLSNVPETCRVLVIGLHRDPVSTILSYYHRRVFANYGFAWLWALDPRSENTIASAEPFLVHAELGAAAWYVFEMACRRAYYRRLLAVRPGVTFVEVSLEQIATVEGARTLLSHLGMAADSDPVLPAPANVSDRGDSSKDRAIVELIMKAVAWDPEGTGERYFDAGWRLGAGPAKLEPRETDDGT